MKGEEHWGSRRALETRLQRLIHSIRNFDFPYIRFRDPEPKTLQCYHCSTEFEIRWLKIRNVESSELEEETVYPEFIVWQDLGELKSRQDPTWTRLMEDSLTDSDKNLLATEFEPGSIKRRFESS